MINDGSRVLDIGCGDGALLDYLGRNKAVDGRGIEISQDGVNACVANGLSVIQGDADTDLEYFPDDAFDYVLLTRIFKPRVTRAKWCLIWCPSAAMQLYLSNFGHWRVRLEMLLRGRMPIVGDEKASWYDAKYPSLHNPGFL